MDPLAAAIQSGDLDRCRALLDERPERLEADLKFEPEDGEAFSSRPLHGATFFANVDLMTELIDRGANLDALNAENRTPLHVALEFSNQVRDLLIGRGARVDAIAAGCLGDIPLLERRLAEDPAAATDTSTDLSPLGWAAYHGQVESTKVLLRHGADPNDGALLCAAMVGAVPVGRALVEGGADPDHIVGGFCGNALHAAATMRYTQDGSPFVEFLLGAGADPHLPADDGATALEIARRSRESNPVQARDAGFARSIELLERAGAR